MANPCNTDDEVTVALDTLQLLANEKGFAVPGDGNCRYSIPARICQCK